MSPPMRRDSAAGLPLQGPASVGWGQWSVSNVPSGRDVACPVTIPILCVVDLDASSARQRRGARLPVPVAVTELLSYAMTGIPQPLSATSAAITRMPSAQITLSAKAATVATSPMTIRRGRSAASSLNRRVPRYSTRSQTAALAPAATGRKWTSTLFELHPSEPNPNGSRSITTSRPDSTSVSTSPKASLRVTSRLGPDTTANEHP